MNRVKEWPKASKRGRKAILLHTCGGSRKHATEGPVRMPSWNQVPKTIPYMYMFSPNSIQALYLDPLGARGTVVQFSKAGLVTFSPESGLDFGKSMGAGLGPNG